MGLFGDLKRASATGGGGAKFEPGFKGVVKINALKMFKSSDPAKPGITNFVAECVVHALDPEVEEQPHHIGQRLSYITQTGFFFLPNIKAIVVNLMGMTEAEFDQMPTEEGDELIEGLVDEEVNAAEGMLVGTETYNKDTSGKNKPVHPFTRHIWFPAEEVDYVPDEVAE